MKKIFFSLLMVLMLCVFPLMVGAEETVADTTETIYTETTDAEAPTVENAAPEAETTVPEAPKANTEKASASHTLFTRVWEFVRTYSQEVISVAGSFVIVVLNFVLKHSGSKTSKEIALIKKGVTDTEGSQKNVVEAVNSMIEGYNGLSQRYDTMKESYDAYGATEDERNRVVGAVLATNTAILEILTTVYANSKNLPQGVKDLVNIKYANCLKTLDDDEKMKAIVEAVRHNIGSLPETTEEEPKSTEE
jgi:hypothetical protein